MANDSTMSVGRAGVSAPERPIVDLAAEPLVPVIGWEVEEHRGGGQLEWNPAQVELYFSFNQKDKKVIKGDELREELNGQPVCNANLLDFLLANPRLIPEEWKHKRVYFWGTIYRRFSGNLCVRCLCWDGSRWNWDYNWLDGDFRDYSPAVLFASKIA